MRIIKILSKLCFISILSFIVINLSNININKSIQIIMHMKKTTCCFIICAFIINFQLSAFRNYIAYKQFKLPMTFSEIRLALLSGILGGIIPVFGAALSQSMVLNKRTNTSSTISILLYFYDKIVMALAGLILSCIASYSLFCNSSLLQKFSIIHEGIGASLLEFIVVLLVCLLISFIYIIPDDKKKIMLKLINKHSIFYALLGMLISFLIWMISANCFLQFLQDYDVNLFYVAKIKIFYACLIISFLASLPISINGWGVREFSAIVMLGTLAIPAEVALSAAITIGVLSTLSILILFILYTIPTIFMPGESINAAKK